MFLFSIMYSSVPYFFSNIRAAAYSYFATAIVWGSLSLPLGKFENYSHSQRNICELKSIPVGAKPGAV